MALSKKHYEQFAYRFARQSERVNKSESLTSDEKRAALGSLNELAVNMAVDFALDNPGFKRDLFLKACGF